MVVVWWDLRLVVYMVGLKTGCMVGLKIGCIVGFKTGFCGGMPHIF